MLPDAKLVDTELQITAESPIGGFGVYDLYPGTYLGREVWCKKLSYGDPDGKAMMVSASFYPLVPNSIRPPSRGSGGRLISGASFGRGTKNSIAWKALRLGCYLSMAFTCPTRVPRKFAEVSSTTLSDVRVQVPCECKVRTWNPPRGIAIRGTTERLEACEGPSIRRGGSLLTVFTDQGDRRGSSPCSHHGTPHLPWRSQLRACFAYRVALVLIAKTCRRRLSLTRTGIRCCRISGSRRYLSPMAWG